jgi:hypothetical protein
MRRSELGNDPRFDRGDYGRDEAIGKRDDLLGLLARYRDRVVIGRLAEPLRAGCICEELLGKPASGDKHLLEEPPCAGMSLRVPILLAERGPPA